MTIYDAMVELVGAVPAGYEIIAWMFAGAIFLFLIRSVFGILYSLFDWMGGR